MDFMVTNQKSKMKIKNLIIIEDEPFEIHEIITALNLALFKRKKKTYESSSKLENELISKGLKIEKFSTNKEILKKFKKAIPANTVIILDGNLKDGTTDELFKLFSAESKKLTLVRSADYRFCERARQNDFKNFVGKSIISDENCLNLGKNILELMK